uniref:granzyme K n=1 Tax=Maylandia zebra TaxID=106582 RepID=UPI000D30F167|nr:granzyme K [Maylandia zebra]
MQRHTADIFNVAIAQVAEQYQCRGSEIINGKEVKPHSLPYMAYATSFGGRQKEADREVEAQCAGSAVFSPSLVASTSQSAIERSGSYWVMLGAHSRTKNEHSKQLRVVEKSFPHPGYCCAKHDNDLMLLKVREIHHQYLRFFLTFFQLKEPVLKTREVQWLEVGNTVRDPAAGSTCLVAGWGETETKQPSDVLKSVNVTVVDRQTCNSRDYYNHDPVITDDMICAGSDGTNVADTCQGDSGGPLLCDGALVGVTSFGEDCGVIKKPGVYSFISGRQLSWIKTTMKLF